MGSRGLSSRGAITICRCIRGNRDGEGKREGGKGGKKYRKANAFEFVYLYIFRVAPSETSDVKPFLM